MFSTTEITSSEISSDNPVHQRLLKAYIEAVKIVQGNILEVGCGIGRGLDVLAENVTDYTAIDKNKELIALLQAKYPTFKFIERNIPPFEGIADNSFDFVISFQVIEHIQNDALFVKEIHRVLKKGGKVILSTPNRKLSLTRNPWHIREYTAEGLQTLMQQYFAKVEPLGIHGNQKVMDYYEANKKAVKKITRFDIFNLQYILPRQILQIPYDLLNRLNRKNLHKQNNTLVNQINHEDYILSQTPDKSLDLFYIAEKS